MDCFVASRLISRQACRYTSPWRLDRKSEINIVLFLCTFIGPAVLALPSHPIKRTIDKRLHSHFSTKTLEAGMSSDQISTSGKFEYEASNFGRQLSLSGAAAVSNKSVEAAFRPATLESAEATIH